MDLAHYHLLLNHWPIIGTFIGLGLFIVALAARSDDLKQASLVVFCLMGLVAIPAYTTGALASDVILDEAAASKEFVATHQGAALIALISAQVTSVFAWVSLWQARRSSPSTGWGAAVVVLLCAMGTVALMSITGNTGGGIGHPEIRTGGAPTSIVGSFGLYLDAITQRLVTQSSRWTWPLLETLHFLGLSLLLGTIGILNLRVLGFLKQFPVGPLRRFIPWAIAGLFINIVTGMLFFFGMPFFYIYNIDFQIKMIAVVLAGTNLLLHCTTAFRSCENLAPGEDAPPLGKILAASSMLLWLAVIALGRYMPLYEDTLGF